MGTGTACEDPPSGFSQVTKLVPCLGFSLAKLEDERDSGQIRRCLFFPEGSWWLGSYLDRHSIL